MLTYLFSPLRMLVMLWWFGYRYGDTKLYRSKADEAKQIEEWWCLSRRLLIFLEAIKPDNKIERAMHKSLIWHVSAHIDTAKTMRKNIKKQQKGT